MEDELFDLGRLRRAWDADVQAIEPALPHPRLEDVVAKVEPLEEAPALLARLDQLVRARFPGERAALGPFLERAAREVDALVAASKAAEPADAEEKRAEASAALMETLDDLEELLEVFTRP